MPAKAQSTTVRTLLSRPIRISGVAARSLRGTDRFWANGDWRGTIALMLSLNRGANSTSGSPEGLPARNAAMMPGGIVAESVGNAATATKPLALADSACVFRSTDSSSRRMRSMTGGSSRPMGVRRTGRVLRSSRADAKRGLQLPDLYGERGLRDVHGLRRTRETGVPRSRDERLQVPQFYVH